MTADAVYVLIDGKRTERFLSYCIDSDMFIPDDAFSLELAAPEIPIKNGMSAEVYVNDQLELTGIVEKIEPKYDKNGSKLTVTGRDLMGWLVDAHVTEFGALKDKNFVDLCQRLLDKAPSAFFDIKDIIYSDADGGRLKTRGARASGFDLSAAMSQIEPGMTVFEALSEYAKSRGLIFYLTADGNFVVGRPKDSGAPQFSIVHRLSGRGNNVLSGGMIDDISKRYSEVIVVGQKQGANGFSAADANIEASFPDDSFPFYKPYVLKDEFGGSKPRLQAQLTVEKMRHNGFRLNYVVPGHSQGGKNWTINELARVVDEDPYINKDGSFLLYGRTFKKSKQGGTSTELRLGLPGMRA